MSIPVFETTISSNTTTRPALVRKDSKDSCYSEEMSEDLSSTNIDDCCRLSPLATQPLSRKSSASGDSAVSMEYDGELSRDFNSFKRNLDKAAVMNGHHSNIEENDFISKLAMLEEKLRNMETVMRKETEKRVQLEKKVTKLEEENEKLTALRTQAVSQLQTFSEKFFSLAEPKHISPVGTPPLQSPKTILSPKLVYTPRLQSPRHSQLELRRISSNSSMTSRLSGQSYPSMTSRHSNISL